jgi:hypothetical protein
MMFVDKINVVDLFPLKKECFVHHQCFQSNDYTDLSSKYGAKGTFYSFFNKKH